MVSFNTIYINAHITIINIAIDDISLVNLTIDTIPSLVIKLSNPLPVSEKVLNEVIIEKQNKRKHLKVWVNELDMVIKVVVLMAQLQVRTIKRGLVAKGEVDEF